MRLITELIELVRPDTNVMHRTRAAEKQRAHDEEKKKKEAEAKAAEHVVRDRVLKIVGGIIAGLGTAGVVGIVGAGVLWLRFKEAGLPAIQAVNVQPQHEALVQGAQTTITFLLIALIGVLLAFFATLWDPRKLSWNGCLALLPLPFGASVYVALTHLSPGWVFLLCVLAFLLYIGCLEVGKHVVFPFWALALSVFAATLIFSAVTGFLIVQQQKFIQPVAILRGSEDTGLTGFYVAADTERVYFAQSINAPDTSPKSKALQAVKLSKGVTYSIGPLQSIEDAERSAEAMRKQLIANRESASEGSSEQQNSTTSKALPSWVESGVAATFDAGIEAHEATPGESLCLMRYLMASKGTEKGKWWMPCAEAEAQASIDNVRDLYALPRRFQREYNERVKVDVPAETALRYVEGDTAPQCGGGPGQPCGYRYPGGGLQYWIKEPEKLGTPMSECTTTEPDEASAWHPCK